MASEHGSSPGPAVESSALEAAQTTERELREQINDLVKARARAEAESRRLEARAGMAAAGPGLAAVAARYRSQAERLAQEIEALRSLLRQQEPVTESLRADEAGA